MWRRQNLRQINVIILLPLISVNSYFNRVAILAVVGEVKCEIELTCALKDIIPGKLYQGARAAEEQAAQLILIRPKKMTFTLRCISRMVTCQLLMP